MARGKGDEDALQDLAVLDNPFDFLHHERTDAHYDNTSTDLHMTEGSGLICNVLSFRISESLR